MSEVETDLFGEKIIVSSQGGITKARDESVFRQIGASNHSEGESAGEDFYATPPFAVEELLKLEEFSHKILEPCCGMGHIGKVLEANGFEVDARDLIDRGYGKGGMDFLHFPDKGLDCDIITNPPYNLAKEFVEKSLDVIKNGHKVAMFLKIQFLEGKKRRELFRNSPPVRVWVSSSRLSCGKNGVEWMPSVICYAWFVWVKGFKGSPTIGWWN